MSAEDERLKRLLEPCKTGEELSSFIKDFLNIELPWDSVDEESTSSPMKFVWAVYSKLLTNKGPTRHVLAAGRNCAKTLTSAIIQFLGMIHFRRDGNHISATLDQSAALIRYVDKFMNLPELLPYKVKDNVKRKELVGLPPNSYTTKSHCSLMVVTASKKGANSSRSSLLTLDEADLTPREIISEVAYVADPDVNKFDPVFVYLSSRKTNDGPIQDLIDQAEAVKNIPGKRIRLHKWSVADYMEKCPQEVHKPELGKIPAYINTETLKVVWSEVEFSHIASTAAKSQYKEVSAYEGCKACPAFIACQARSAKQRSSSPMLRTRQFVGDILDAVGDPAVIIAQSLNWKPETTGLVFKTFSRHKHLKDPIDFYEWATGTRFNPLGLPEQDLDAIEKDGDIVMLSAITPTKDAIYKGMIDAGWTIGFGVDWGFSPDPANVIVCGWHRKLKRFAILHYEFANNYANHVWAEYVGKTIHKRFPGEFVAPDLADKSSPTYFAKHKLPSLDTKPARIEPGVSFIRGLMWNPITQSSSMAILDDSQMDNGNIHVVEAFEHWGHAKSITGKFDMDKFADDKWTHPLDACRYFLAPFIEDKQVTISVGQKAPTHSLVEAMALGDKDAKETIEKKQELRSQMQEYFQMEHGISNPFSKPTNVETGRLTPTSQPQESKPRPKNGGIKFRV